MPSLPDSWPFRAPRLPAAIVIVTTTALAPSLARAQTVPLQTRGEVRALMQACRVDYDRFCVGVLPGGGRILACLQSHATELSATCVQSIPRAQTLRTNATAGPVMSIAVHDQPTPPH